MTKRPLQEGWAAVHFPGNGRCGQVAPRALRGLVGLTAFFSFLQAGTPQTCISHRLESNAILVDPQVFAISSQGNRILFAASSDLTGSNPRQRRQLFRLDTRSRQVEQLTDFRVQSATDWVRSDDSLERIVFHSSADPTGGNGDGSSEIFLLEAASQRIVQLTDTAQAQGMGSSDPVISGDGRWIAFRSSEELGQPNGSGVTHLYSYFLGDDLAGLEQRLQDGHGLSRLTQGENPAEGAGVPSIDGASRIAFVWRSSDALNVFGNAAELRLYDLEAQQWSTLRAALQLNDPVINARGDYIVVASVDDLKRGGNADRNAEVYGLSIDQDGSAGELEQITFRLPSDDRESRLDDLIQFPSVSGYGDRIAFVSEFDLTGENPQGYPQLFSFDRAERTLSQITRAPAGARTATPPLNDSGDRLALVVLRDASGQHPQSGVDLIWMDCRASQAPVFVLPQIVDGRSPDGGVVRSELILTNPGRLTERGTIAIRSTAGAPMSLMIGGELRDQVPFVIPPGGSFRIETDGQSDATRVGYVAIFSDLEESKLSGSLIYSSQAGAASVPGAAISKEYHVFAEFNQNSRSGIALVNPASKGMQLNLLLLGREGERLDSTTLELGPGHQYARFIDEFFETAGSGFEGSVHVRSDWHFAMIGLRQNQEDTSLAVLQSAPTAFPNSGSQIFYLLDAGLDLSSLRLSSEALENSSVFQLLGIDEPARRHRLELTNTHSSQAATVLFRFYNEDCRVVLEFLRTLDCGEILEFDPFDMEIPQRGLGTREWLFGTSQDPHGNANAAQFGTGRFVLEVSAVGASLNADDTAERLFPFEEVVASLRPSSCRALDHQVGIVPGQRDENLHLCNARLMSFDYLTGRQLSQADSSCQGNVWLPSPALEDATRASRSLVRDEETDCLGPVEGKCSIVQRLALLPERTCPEGPVGPSVVIKYPDTTFTLPQRFLDQPG